MKAKEADKIIEENWPIIRQIADKGSLIFRLFGWTWGYDEQEHIPNANEIQKNLEELAKMHLCSNRCGGSGRFLFVPSATEDGFVEVEICLELGTLVGKIKAPKKK